MATQPSTSRRLAPEIRNALVLAALMLLVPLTLKVAARSGWNDAYRLSDRSLMVLLGGYIASIGNSIPKRLAPLAALADPARAQSFARFAGWTWALTGTALALCWLVLPLEAAGTSTFIVLPAGIALIALRCIGLRWTRQPAA
jgi:hypothetical protein